MHRSTSKPPSPKRSAQSIAKPVSPKRAAMYAERATIPLATDFLLAAENGDLAVVNRYIEANESNRRAMNVTTTTKGLSGLSLAAQAGHLDMVNALLDVDCIDIDAHERHEETALYLAAYAGHLEVVVALLAAGAKLIWRDEVLKKVEDNHFLEITTILKNHEERLSSLSQLISMSDLQLNRAIIGAVLTLSPKRYALFYDMTANLFSTSMMTNESFCHALNIVMRKYPRVIASSVTENKSSQGYEYSVNNQVCFFVHSEAKKCPEYSGNHGFVNKGYAKNNTQPGFAVKWVAHPNDAPHEAKYNQFFEGRKNTIWFRNKNRTALVYEWRTGASLNEYKSKQLMNFTVLDRVRCLTHFLGELSHLHGLMRAHNDIKQANAVLDIQLFKLELIDFGKAKKVTNREDFQPDMYETHRLITYLFPDLNKGDDSRLKQAIRDLLEAINPRSRKVDSCTSEQAWQFCKQISAAGRSLTAENLTSIKAATIFRKCLTIEDVLRGRRLV